ncbi:MAG: hypothetical protein QOE05_1879 [Actinomycetota bacterium]|jgi:hypothetical protein|nr:hypothetical protein [Actinomycetota bacterium]
MRARITAVLLVAGLLGGCMSSGDAPKTGSSVATTAALPSPTPSMSAEIVTACLHVRTAFEQQATRNWKAVLTELKAASDAAHSASDRQLARLLPPTGALRLDDTKTLGAVTDTLAFACGLPSRPIPGSSPAAPNRREVVLSVDAVDGVRMGTPADEAERRLRQSLGDANAEDVSGCDGEKAKRLTWGSFSVKLTNEGKGPMVLRGWTLRAGVSRVSYRTPYDVQPGDPVRDALARVPGAQGVIGEGPTDGRYVVHTDRSPELLWISDEKGRAGTVEEITFHDPSCD